MRIGRLVMCLDVGYCHTGVAIYDFAADKFIHAEVINTEKSSAKIRVSIDNIARCQYIFRRLSVLQTKFRCSEVLAEIPHGGAKSSRAMSAMAMSVAVLSCFIARFKVKFTPVYPIETKRWVCPNQKVVTKKAVIAYVTSRFGRSLFPKQTTLWEHVADAMCLVDVKYGHT